MWNQTEGREWTAIEPWVQQLRCPVLTVLRTILHFRDYGHLGSETPSALSKVTQLSSGRVGI